MTYEEGVKLAEAIARIKELEKRAETSLYISPESFSLFIEFLEVATVDLILDFGSSLDEREIKQIELLQAFCEQHTVPSKPSVKSCE